MTRVAWILYGSLERRTGGTIYDREIVRGLERAVHVEVIELPFANADAPGLVRRIAKLRPHVVVGDELCHPELAFLFSRWRGTKVLLVHHLGCWEEERGPRGRRRTRYTEALALRHASYAIATSETTRRRLEGEGHRGRIEVVLPGADRLPHFQNVGPNRVQRTLLGPTFRGETFQNVGPNRVQRTLLGPTFRGVRFLFVGALVPRKRVLELVRALPGADAELVIVGAAPDAAYARAVGDAARARGVRLLGELDETGLARELAVADALVMPSSLEGYGIAATEAVRAGVPVVATRSPGLVEALAPCAEAAVLVDDAGPALAATLERIATDSKLRARLRAGAAAARMPTWDGARAGFLEILRRSTPLDAG